MVLVTLNFQVHQPFRISQFQSNGFMKITDMFNSYFNNGLNKYIFDRVANKCYLPTNSILLEALDKLKNEKNEFKVSFSLSGTFLESAELFHKDVLESFRQLAKHKCVEILGETYFHSLASMYESKTEFIEQVEAHRQSVKDYLGVIPKVFVNTEMIYNNSVAKVVEGLGYKGIFTEGSERILGWRSPNYLYLRKFCFPDDPPPKNRIRILLRNYRLSDDVAYRFSAREWEQWPLTAEKYVSWLNATPGEVINLFMDYETFGEHQPAESGIFWFLKAFPYIAVREGVEFATPSEVVARCNPIGEIDVFEFSTLSWADMERDVSAWLGNKMQHVIFNEVKALESQIKSIGDPQLIKIWRMLQQSDHCYYMCTKFWSDGDVHKYFSSFERPEDAFANMMNILADFKMKVHLAKQGMLDLQKI